MTIHSIQSTAILTTVYFMDFGDCTASLVRSLVACRNLIVLTRMGLYKVADILSYCGTISTIIFVPCEASVVTPD